MLLICFHLSCKAPLIFQRKIKRKRQIKKHRKNMSRYKLSVLLRNNLRGENKTEKKLKGSQKEENGSVQNTEQKD